jgi:hypothetical protein
LAIHPIARHYTDWAIPALLSTYFVIDTM